MSEPRNVGNGGERRGVSPPVSVPPVVVATGGLTPRRSPMGKTPHPEEECLADLTTTAVSPRTARVMTWLFVLLVVSVPVTQVVIAVSRRQQPQVLALFQPLRTAIARVRAGQGRAAVAAAAPLLQPQYLHAFEDDLERASLARRFFQPRVQLLLSRLGKFGNDRCVVGRSGWLFYQPGVEAIFGPNFLSGDALRLRRAKLVNRQGGDPQLDPRPAILQFYEDCARAGVHLVLVPIPDKAAVQPVQLTRRLGHADQPVPPNAGQARLLDELRSWGVDVYDPTPATAQGWEHRYLEQDTHWTPAYMEEVARALAEHIDGQIGFPPPPRSNRPFLRGRRITHTGDLVAMLRLPPGQTLFQPETVMVHQVLRVEDLAPWQPDPDADVLLLGDSFTNIYSDGEGQEGLGWGQAAGLAPHLARHLGRPLDVIAHNGGGASQTRADLARRPEPLRGKRVVVWEFASRELAQAEWKVIPLRNAGTASGTGPAPDSPRLVADVTVLAASTMPRPNQEMYTDCIALVKVRVDQVLEGTFRGDCLIAAFRVMKNNELLPAARYQPGDRLRLKLAPPRRGDGQGPTVQYSDTLNDYEHPTYLVEEEHRP